MTFADRLKALALMAGIAFAFLAGCSEDGTGEDRTDETEPEAAVPAGSAAYGINVEISAAEGMADAGEAATVYVFLRQPGVVMPLAVEHFPAGELPRTVAFIGDDRQEAVELVVRLSPSGRIARSPEDLEVIEALPGLLHPPQTVAVVLGGAGSAPAGVAPAETATGARLIRIRVAIDGPHEFAPDTVVFVIARKPGQGMPTAVRRVTVAELPAEIELTDQDAMRPGNRLSDAGSLDVLARVSTTGTASQSGADWLSEIVHLDPTQPPGLVALTIRRPE